MGCFFGDARRPLLRFIAPVCNSSHNGCITQRQCLEFAPSTTHPQETTMKNTRLLKICAALLSISVNLALFVAIDIGFTVPVSAASPAPIKL